MTPRRLLACFALAAMATAAAADFQGGVEAASAGNYALALREWQPLAEQGHRDAQFNLALLYDNGLGVPVDRALAAQWFRRAAEQDDRAAQAHLAEMYALGLGLERNDIEALRWYRRAAERGHAASQYNVGLFYALGRGVAPNEVQAFAWLSVALENGARPTELLDLLRRNMTRRGLQEARTLAEEIRRQCRLD